MKRGLDLSTPWTKSDRSAQPGRSPDSRLIAFPAPSHPLADSGISGRLTGYSGASAADSHRFPCSRPPVGRAGLGGLNFAECYQRPRALSTAEEAGPGRCIRNSKHRYSCFCGGRRTKKIVFTDKSCHFTPFQLAGQGSADGRAPSESDKVSKGYVNGALAGLARGKCHRVIQMP